MQAHLIFELYHDQIIAQKQAKGPIKDDLYIFEHQVLPIPVVFLIYATFLFLLFLIVRV
jgi:hypothetical protein